jgi:hypothetical protein
MIGYWVAVGVLSTTALCVRHHHRWLLELTARLPLFVFVLGWAMLSTLWSQNPAFTAGRAPRSTSRSSSGSSSASR